MQVERGLARLTTEYFAGILHTTHSVQFRHLPCIRVPRREQNEGRRHHPQDTKDRGQEPLLYRNSLSPTRTQTKSHKLTLPVPPIPYPSSPTPGLPLTRNLSLFLSLFFSFHHHLPFGGRQHGFDVTNPTGATLGTHGLPKTLPDAFMHPRTSCRILLTLPTLNARGCCWFLCSQPPPCPMLTTN